MRKGSRAKLTTVNEVVSPEGVEALISQHVPRLSQYIEREVAYFLDTDDLVPDLMPVEAVIDETVVQALSEYRTRPLNVPFDRWLMALANEVLNQRLQQEQQRREASHSEERRIEQRLSRVPPEQKGAAVEDEIYNWYQPDENLHMEDIVPDPHVSSPEEIIASRELRHDLDEIIASLPKRWRDVFVLHSIEDFTLEQVTLVTGQTLDEVQQDLCAAREFLRERLIARQSLTPVAFRKSASH